MKRWGMLMACATAALVWGGAPAMAGKAARGEARAGAPAPRAEARNAETRNPSRARPAARVQRGKASYYAPDLAGRRMADGGRFDPRSDAAAHRTLPLGSKARVTNLGNGRSAMVTVRDRGPRAPGRILDVSPGTAERLGMTGAGVAAVEVAPLEAPRTGGGAGPGSAASGGGAGRAWR
jgi:peptidoglycan lytic transglycosylase